MNRAEKRRQKKVALKATRIAKLEKATIRPPDQQNLTVQQAIDLAVQHHTAGRLPEAENVYNQILQVEPNQPVALHLLGVIAHQVGKNYIAVDLITKALGIKPDYVEAHSNLGNALRDMGKLEESVASCNKALAIKPDYAEAHSELGNALRDMGKLEESVASHNRALAIKPDFAMGHSNLGNALRDMGKLEESVASHNKALAIKPDFAEAHSNLGNALRDMGKLEESVASYNKALAIKPDFAMGQSNLGNALRDMGKLEESVASHNKALAIKPDYAEAHNNLGNALKALGKLDEAVASYHKALAIKPDYAGAHSNLIFTMLHFPFITGGAILKEALRWDQQHGYRGEIAQHDNAPDPERRLRIGYVSADFRLHAASYLLEPLLAGHNREEVELFCYAEVLRPDHVTGRFKGYADHWRSTVGISDAQLAETIREDMIDIIVDCTGHMANNRLLALTRKPAPVQVLIGHNGTSGVKAMDYALSDPVLTPPGFEDQFSEEVFILPQGAVTFHPNPDWPEVAPPPSIDDGPVFACVGNPVRIDSTTITLWARLLEMVPKSRLLFKHKAYGTPKAREGWRTTFKELGDRAIFEGVYGVWSENMDVYARVDVVLDTLPMSGGLSCAIPLWMGVPVITMASPNNIHRFGTAIVTHAGMAEFSTDNPEDYLRIACDLIKDRERLASLRRTMRDTIRASHLMDARGYVAEVEAAFRKMWRKWCA